MISVHVDGLSNAGGDDDSSALRRLLDRDVGLGERVVLLLIGQPRLVGHLLVLNSRVVLNALLLPAVLRLVLMLNALVLNALVLNALVMNTQLLNTLLLSALLPASHLVLTRLVEPSSSTVEEHPSAGVEEGSLARVELLNLGRGSIAIAVSGSQDLVDERQVGAVQPRTWMCSIAVLTLEVDRCGIVEEPWP
jgi:hypothetical protein